MKVVAGATGALGKQLVAGGKFAVVAMTELRGASNEKAKHDLGWELSFPTWRRGFTDGLR